MRSPWEPIALGLVVWLIGGIAGLFTGQYDVTAGIVVVSVFGAAGAMAIQVGVIALGVRLGNRSRN